jgi:hypothetical protein
MKNSKQLLNFLKSSTIHHLNSLPMAIFSWNILNFSSGSKFWLFWFGFGLHYIYHYPITGKKSFYILQGLENETGRNETEKGKFQKRNEMERKKITRKENSRTFLACCQNQMVVPTFWYVAEKIYEKLRQHC